MKGTVLRGRPFFVNGRRPADLFGGFSDPEPQTFGPVFRLRKFFIIFVKNNYLRTMLRKIRIVLAGLCLVAITLLFLGLSGDLTRWVGWLPKLQFLPAFLAVNVGIILLWVVLTLVFGRIYCSVICPLGVYQDLVSWLSSRRKGKKMRFRWRPGRKWLRLGMLVLFCAALLAGVHGIVALLAPYSAYGRMVRTLVAPATTATVVVAALTFVVVTVLAWLDGRAWCNSICPVGTTLGFLSRFALLRPVIDTAKCTNCRACERKCKASCIRIPDHEIDYSRCVDCFDCLDSCKFGAMKYRFAPGKTASGSASGAAAPAAADTGRRAFMTGAALAVGTAALKAQSKKLDGGLAPILDKRAPERTAPLTPSGSVSARHFYQHCTACQLCVANCPNKVLRPSTDLDRIMQPEMGYEHGWCRPECVKCAEVCPTGAIRSLSPAEKSRIHIGTASVDRSLCVVGKDGVKCGNCARHCPAGAIMMVRLDKDDPDSLLIPAVDESRCIGCGACENLCPSRPYSAIRVNGLQVHIQD